MRQRPLFCSRPGEFREWLATHHESEAEVWVGFYKKGSGRPSMTWSESVDEALCFGWIDGVRHSLDADSYAIRFTPRKTGSNWSLVNIRKVASLIRAKRMHPAGLRAYEARDPKKSGVYSFERAAAAFGTVELKTFKASTKAWKFWESQPPGYRKTATYWVVSAKRPETREKRLRTLVDDSAAGMRIVVLRRDKQEEGKKGKEGKKTN